MRVRSAAQQITRAMMAAASGTKDRSERCAQSW